MLNTRLALFGLALLLENQRFLSHGFLALDHQVTQDRIVVAEQGRQFFKRLTAAFDVHHHIMRFVNLVDRIGELSAPPVFDAMDVTAAVCHQLGVALNHSGHLL